MLITYPNGRVVNYMYNTGDDDALSRISYYSDSSGTLVAYTYFGLGSIVQVSYPQPGVVYTLAGGSSPNPSLGLDGFGRVASAEWLQGTTALVQIGYGYDLASNRTYRQDDAAEAAGAAFDESYGYDRMQRLIKLNRGTLSSSSSSSSSPSPSTGEGWGGGALPPIINPTLQQGWHLDATGNWMNFTNLDQTNSANTLDQQRASNTANEITAVNRTVGPQWATPAYDRNGNMTSIPEPTNMANPANGTWDAWNRLVWYIDSSLNYHNSLYDGLSRRITYAEADTPRDYYYSDRWQILEERIPPNTGVADRQFVWGLRYIDDCILRDRTTTGTLSERLFAMQDANWNVVAICNTAATVLERYAYTAYGVVQFLNASFVPLVGNVSAYAWETLYCSYRHQAATGLHLARFRWLHSLVGCWLGRDPLRLGPGFNLFGYVHSKPISRLDPTGLSDHHWMPQLDGTAQKLYVKPLCCDKDIPVDIDDFCTTLPGGVKGKTTDPTVTPHSAVEYIVGYRELGKLIYGSAKTCCELLAWFTLAREAATYYLGWLDYRGRLEPKLELGGEGWTMHRYLTPEPRTDALWKSLLVLACGKDKTPSPPEKLRKIIRQIYDQAEKLRPQQEPGIQSDVTFFLGTVAVAGAAFGAAGRVGGAVLGSGTAGGVASQAAPAAGQVIIESIEWIMGKAA